MDTAQGFVGKVRERIDPEVRYASYFREREAEVSYDIIAHYFNKLVRDGGWKEYDLAWAVDACFQKNLNITEAKLRDSLKVRDNPVRRRK